ncbi:hypothetical protein FRB98_002253 [Tulasnella sp. 332]|nr:hypothetical protein FRB98_002253 [Tulasnella sp. 332]
MEEHIRRAAADRPTGILSSYSYQISTNYLPTRAPLNGIQAASMTHHRNHVSTWLLIYFKKQLLTFTHRSGIGKELSLAALKRGDKVIATARNITKIDPVLKSQGADTLQLDVTDSFENLKTIATKATAIHGRVNVLVNNAGYIAVGGVEEATPEETYQQFKSVLRLFQGYRKVIVNVVSYSHSTNVFGSLNVSRAFLPEMRQRKSGTIIFIGSIGGWRGMAGAGLYSATKHAIREPRISDYNAIIKGTHDELVAYNGKQPGNPEKLLEVVVDIAHGEGIVAGRDIPVTLALGSDAWNVVKEQLTTRGKVLDEWKSVIESTDF